MPRRRRPRAILPRLRVDGPAGSGRHNMGARHGGSQVERKLDLRGLSYTDPDKPKFAENRRPIRCSYCGNVPKFPALIVDGLCKNRGACEKRGPAVV